jgi:hypothetical protein
MIDWLVRLPLPVGVSLSVFVAISFGLLTHWGVWLFVREHATSDLKALAGNLFRISGTLLGLLLSLTFADVRGELVTLRDTIERESAQLADIHADLGRFDSPAAELVRDDIEAYSASVVSDEWAALEEGRISQRTTEIFDEVEVGLLGLKPESPAQETLRSRLLEDVDEITDLRTSRYFHSTVPPPAFLYIAVLGYLCTMGMLGVHEPSSRSLMLMSFYCAFVGMVIYFILSLSHPFEGIARIAPDAFEAIYRGVHGGG